MTLIPPAPPTAALDQLGFFAPLTLPTLSETVVEKPTLVNQYGRPLTDGAPAQVEGDTDPMQEPEAEPEAVVPDPFRAPDESQIPADLVSDAPLTDLAVAEPATVVAEVTEPAPANHVEYITDPVVVERAPKFRVFSLIDPDRRWVMIVAIVLMTGVLFANLITSFTNVYAMAAWIGIPVEVQWLPVVILDVAIVGFSWGLMVFKSRGAPVLRTRVYIGVVTAFSVIANFMHTFDHWHGDLTTPQAVTGIAFSSAIPLMSLVITEELIRLVFKLRDRRKEMEVQA